MKDSHSDRGVIPASTVRRLDQKVLVDCGSGHAEGTNQSLTVIPLADGDLIAGLEIHCSCGASAVVECIYGTEEGS